MSEQQKSVADQAQQDSDKDQESDVVFGEEDPENFWSNEAEKLGQSDWFNPDTGSTEITFLNEGKNETRTYEGEKRPVRVFNVEVEGKELKWSVTRGRSESSLYGQLVKVGADSNGLTDVTITLIRQGTGTDTQYTVQEAADL